MTDQNWRTEVDYLDLFGHQRKRDSIDSRRPVLRKAADLVGPGITDSAVRVTNWSNELALFNGYYSSLAGAFSAPNAVENFTGFTVMDSVFGGTQTLTGMASNLEYKRTFRRNPSDPTIVGFDPWVASDPTKVPQSGRTTATFNGSQLSDLKFVVFNNPFPAGTTPVVTMSVVGEDPRVTWAVDQTTSGNPHLSFGIRAYFIPQALTATVYFNWEARYATQ